MSSVEIALKSNYCSGCNRTVDLVLAGSRQARCPICAREYALDVPAAIHDLRPERVVRNPYGIRAA